MDKFENVFVGYMLNQARMPFFVTSHYPHYDVKDGKLVTDTSDASKSLRADALEGYDLLRRMSDRVKRGIRIPRTWAKKLEEKLALVIVLEREHIATKEWCEEFYRTLRWLKTLTA